MKFYALALSALLLTAISTSVNAQDNVTKALLDTAFAKGSTVAIAAVSPQQVKNLALLGQVWGFVKYHHLAIAKGSYNMDAKLFEVMPAIINAKNAKETAAAIEKWVDGFGVPEKCANCKPYGGDNILIKPNYGMIFDKSVVGASLVAKLKHILDNRNQGPNHYIKLNGRWNTLSIQNELPYTDMAYPDAGYRLLTAYRFWNIIQYYYPYRDIIGQDWSKVLPELIIDFVAAKDALGYQLAATKMVASVNDAHAGVANPEVDKAKGSYLLPIQGRFIDDKFVMTGYYNDVPEIKEKLKLGDVITDINGVSTVELVKKLLPLTSGSNQGSKLRNMAYFDILRSKGGQVELRILRDNNVATFNLISMPKERVRFVPVIDPEPNALGYRLLDNSIGYLNAGKYKNKDLSEIQKMFNDTKGVIVDLRYYPSDAMPATIATYLKTGDNMYYAKYSYGSIAEPGLFVSSEAVGRAAENLYKGKVVVIVDENTQSRGEFAAMAFQSSTNTTTIGSTTAGADGEAIRFVLPGGLLAAMTGLGVLYPDGTPTQRVGIKIDEVVKPTIEGIRAGKDELLERAKEIILK
ncbi:S41 family peptidase [Mucilaginibacter myungsuensis]|uniref:Peptidase S41 n=1 Tax=Mucilaginibacter myungsuensis TaxID=649104 RepID=A0A929KZI4_9SPHI|nr:S41 family peptidase [Mucilaginibacter myungsuensis]MBE9664586.1 peptidase S41 [Mucilaginibacter myungsuensis]MDN3601064.1 S41 family peptidase [Mucilaginibacter myungsuensis]